MYTHLITTCLGGLFVWEKTNNFLLGLHQICPAPALYFCGQTRASIPHNYSTIEPRV